MGARSEIRVKLGDIVTRAARMALKPFKCTEDGYPSRLQYSSVNLIAPSPTYLSSLV